MCLFVSPCLKGKATSNQLANQRGMLNNVFKFAPIGRLTSLSLGRFTNVRGYMDMLSLYAHVDGYDLTEIVSNLLSLTRSPSR
jgi:hypothetical protein